MKPSPYPQIGYWFFTPSMVENHGWEPMLEDLAKNAPFDFYFLTARNGTNFHDTAAMAPLFERLVAKAHGLGLGIGLQLWEPTAPVPDDEASCHIVEGEGVLDGSGRGTLTLSPKHIRPPHKPFRSSLVSATAFVKTGDGLYRPGSRVDLAEHCTVTPVDDATLTVTVNAGQALAGRTFFIMTRHDCHFAAVHGDHLKKEFTRTLEAYRHIPFDGAALDEQGAMRVTPKWLLEKTGGPFRERPWSLPMAREFERSNDFPILQDLFDMRYVPDGKETARMAAINRYMEAVAVGPEGLEAFFYDEVKRVFGPGAFVGVHNTHHNELPYDEFWVTGNKWWTQKRDFGQTDEHSPLPTQLGILLAHAEPVLYNMFYDKRVDAIADKALGDLAFGIRTHYHAVNDAQGWGTSVERPEVLAVLNPVEACARVLNRFEPAAPRARILTVFGFEALCNWFPEGAHRGGWDLNEGLFIEEKAVEILKAGYPNALVPTDLIGNGLLRLDGKGRPILGSHVFDAMVFLYPQYARETTLAFLETYVQKGGRLMLEGKATHDFGGRDITGRFARIEGRATVVGFKPSECHRLGVVPDAEAHGSFHEDGSYVTVYPKGSALAANPEPVPFDVTVNGVRYTGRHAGLVAIRGENTLGKPQLAAWGLVEIFRDGKVWKKFERPTEVVV